MATRFLLMLPLLLLLLLLESGPASASPCGTNWTYDSTIGWCLRQYWLMLNWTEARDHCDSLRGPAVGARAAGSKLSTPYNATELAAVKRYLTLLGNYGDVWVAARRESAASPYQWVDRNPPENVTSGWADSPGSKNCVFMALVNSKPGTEWTTYIELHTADCSDRKPFFCYYEAKRCSLNDLAGYNPDSMNLPAKTAHIGEAAVANCREGFYRRSVMEAAAMAALYAGQELVTTTQSPESPSTPVPNGVNCTDSARSDDPELVSPVWVQSTIEPCLLVGCDIQPLTEFGIDNSLPFADALVKSGYNFGEGFNVTCKHGYVSSMDPSSKMAQVTCFQDPGLPWLGIWLPSSSSVCVPIKCQDIRTVLANYSGVHPAKAYNQELNRWYSDLEVNRFSIYSSEVYVTCNSVGQFFQDQKYERQLVCLAENDTSTTANWVGIRGTFSTDGVIQNIRCIEVVCNLVDLFHLMEEGGSMVDLLVSYHINEGIMVYDARTNVLSNMTRFHISSMGSLHYGSYISVTCPQDRLFVQSGTDQVNLVLNLAKMTITCSRTGKWNQTIGMCIEKTATIQLLGRQKQYVPPTKEATAAWQTGMVTITIVILFFTSIVVLDLATIKRDFSLLKTNVFYLRMRLRQL